MSETQYKAVGRIGSAEAVEAAKCGVLLEIAIEAIRPSLELLIIETKSDGVEWVSSLPPATGFAIGVALRLALALAEDRGRLLPTIVQFAKYAGRKVAAGFRKIRHYFRPAK